MFRLLFSIGLSVVVARWAYNEIELCAPGLVPLIDYSLEQVQIPTHDKWLGTALSNAAQLVEDGTLESKIAAFSKNPTRLSKRDQSETPPEPTQGFSTAALRSNKAFDRF